MNILHVFTSIEFLLEASILYILRSKIHNFLCNKLKKINMNINISEPSPRDAVYLKFSENSNTFYKTIEIS